MKNIQLFKHIAAGLLLSGSLVGTSCSSDYMDTIPTENVSFTTVSTSLDNLYLALNGIHRKMVSQDLGNQGLGGEPGFIIGREALADDLTWDTQTWHQGFLNWSYPTNATSSYNSGEWETYYKFILNANNILKALNDNFSDESKLTDSEKALANHIKGECLAIRALSHFNLVQYYAKPYRNGQDNSQPGVPYRTSPEIEPMARNTVEEVYTKIHGDLDEALNLLADYEPNDKNHYSLASVYGLKARALLTQQKYADAATAAVNSINEAEKDGCKIMSQSELMNGFANITSATKEAMYAAMTQNDQTVYFYSFYAYMSWNFNSSSIRTGIKCISQSTYDLMSPTDLRRQWWDPTGKAEVPATSYNQRVYQNRKFTARSTADAVGDFAFMRISEMYLTAAEAFARSNQDAKAKEYLQALLKERDPEYKDLGNTGAKLADEIMTHRRIELWGEGFRWFDLKRLGLPLDRTGSNFDATFCGFLHKDPNADGWIFEIPKKETDFNDLIEKNY